MSVTATVSDVDLSTGSDPEVNGKVGRVVIRVRGAAGPGEVVIRIRGGSEAYIAYADEVIERDSDVLVIGYRGHRSVDVVPWEFA